MASILFPRSTVFVSTGDADLSYQVYFFDGTFREDNSARLNTADFLQGADSFETGVSFVPQEGKIFRFDIDPRPRVDRSIVHLPLEPFTVLPIVVSERSLLWTRHYWYDDSQVIVQKAGVEHDGSYYRIVNDDAFFVIDLSRAQPKISEYLSWDALFSLLLVATFVCAGRGYLTLVRTTDIQVLFGFAAAMAVALGMCLAFGLAIGTGHGPDEVMHYPSYFWYQEHLRPPSLNDPVYLQKVWQSSYILGAGGDLTYLLTARTESLLALLFPHLEPLISMRLAQLLLVCTGLGIAVLLFGAGGGLAYLSSWLIVPQLTYTATYLNGDVLSFVLGFLAFGILLIKAPKNGWWVLPALFLLFNLKANYLVLVALLPIVWICIPSSRIHPRLPWILGLALCSPLILYRRLFNWVDQRSAGTSYLQSSYDRLIELRDTTLHPFSYARQSYERRLAGTSSFDWNVLTDPNWYAMSFRSMFGVFGYMEFAVPLWLLAPSVALFALTVWYAAKDGRQAVVIVAVALFSVAASLFYSVSEGYQPQGRYLFPILCVVFLLARVGLQTYARWLPLAALPTLVVLSLYRPGF